jgi:hypothetical protein
MDAANQNFRISERYSRLRSSSWRVSTSSGAAAGRALKPARSTAASREDTSASSGA